MKIRIARLSHSLAEGTFLTIEEMSLTSLILQDCLGDSLFGLLSCIDYEWTYAIRWGETDPEWGFADKSLGSKLSNLAQWAGSGFGAFRKVRDVAHVPVSAAWVHEHYPNAGFPFDGSELPDDHD